MDHRPSASGRLVPIVGPMMLTVRNWLAYGEMARRIVNEAYPQLSEESKLNALVAENVVAHIPPHLQPASASCPSTSSTAWPGRSSARPRVSRHAHIWARHLHSL